MDNINDSKHNYALGEEMYLQEQWLNDKKDDERFKELQKYGFEIFWCVRGKGVNLRYSDDFIFMDRCNLDGYKMNYGQKKLEDLFDIDYVYDKSRPKFE
ncbi:hypothetical protein [Vallitalea sp.]|jgi:hypothetical protein|uniref:hypothetical protein n=1 Tax=Vallitalea sp. TaxID=1882829 RepID=UPI0025F5BC94|nr:hypothetical protein [Vallitalea sp.]MCT4686831.1 hypothetical protein [Vallitalea sp.]